MTLAPSLSFGWRAPTHASVAIASKVRPYSTAAERGTSTWSVVQTVSQPRRSTVSAPASMASRLDPVPVFRSISPNFMSLEILIQRSRR